MSAGKAQGGDLNITIVRIPQISKAYSLNPTQLQKDTAGIQTAFVTAYLMNLHA